MTVSQTAPARLSAAERRRKAVSLRLEGAAYQQIADALNCTRSGAWKMVRRELDTIATEARADAAELRALELARLDDAWRALWSAAIDDGDLAALDRLLKISDARCRLLGLYAPAKVAPVDPTGTREFKVIGGGLAGLLREVRAADDDSPSRAPMGDDTTTTSER